MKRSLTWLARVVLVLAVYMISSLAAERAAAPTGGSAASSAQSGAGSQAAGSQAASSAAASQDEAAAASAAAKAAAIAEAQAQLDDPLMVLVSPAHAMPEGYVVGETVTCSTDVNNGTLAKEAAEAFQAMKAAAKEDGVTLHLQSGYRSVEYQDGLFQRQIQKWKDTGMDTEAATEKAKTVVTPPGHSEHNCGLAADINSPEYYALEEPFKNTKAYAWLCEHAEAYGFILRYPKEKEAVTGIIYEPWHWRYVGAENAARINATGLCLEEYVAQLQATVAG